MIYRYLCSVQIGPLNFEEVPSALLTKTDAVDINFVDVCMQNNSHGQSGDFSDSNSIIESQSLARERVG